MVTWELTIELILETFNLKQKDLANLLHIHPGTVSKIKNGGYSPTFTPEEIFHNIFDPDNKNSPAKDTIKGLLNTLKLIIEQPQYREIREVMDDCWSTADYRTFVETLIRRTRCFPRSRAPKTDISQLSNSKTQSEQLQNLFLMAVRGYKVMDIINRKPAIMTQDDSADLNNFLRDINRILPAYNSCDSLLRASIESFRNALQIQALTLEATLNNKIYSEGENVSINMEDDDMDSVKGNKIKNCLGLPEWSLELVESAEPENRLDLIRLGISEWGNFRNEMNRLFERILSWSNSATDT